MAVVAITGDNLVAGLRGGFHADGDGFLTDIEMAEATDQAHAIKLAGAFFEAADQHHLAVIFQQVVFGDIAQLLATIGLAIFLAVFLGGTRHGHLP